MLLLLRHRGSCATHGGWGKGGKPGGGVDQLVPTWLCLHVVGSEALLSLSGVSASPGPPAVVPPPLPLPLAPYALGLRRVGVRGEGGDVLFKIRETLARDRSLFSDESFVFFFFLGRHTHSRRARFLGLFVGFWTTRCCPVNKRQQK